ncbi:MAG: ATP-dependent DNA helicase RecG [Actinomycetota bacterium]
MTSGSLDTPLRAIRLPGLTQPVVSKLERGLGVTTVRDLLETVPRRYLDLSANKPIGEISPGEEATVSGRIIRVSPRRIRGNRHMLTVQITDQTGTLEMVWWNQPFRERHFTVGSQVVAAGKIDRNRSGRLQITNPFVEALGSSGIHTGRIIPVHPATAGASSTLIRRLVHEALGLYGSQIDEVLPGSLLGDWPPRARAIREIHFPTDQASRAKARARLAFEELVVLSAGLAIRRQRMSQARGVALPGDPELMNSFFEGLGFELTSAQQRAISQINSDLEADRPMNRLLQGDVGAGKTVVALAAAVHAAASGHQTAIMAPTEVLAEQHHLSMRRMLEPIAGFGDASSGRLFGESYRIAVLTGSTPASERREILAGIATGEISILVGTHALIQEGVVFHRLGLAIVDEQHRFGVHQRVALRDKAGGAQPHALIMTATPIPRTLALTAYGDLEVSVLDELPPGREPVETLMVTTAEQRRQVAEDIRAEAAAGHQSFVVCPLVEGSESLEVKAAVSVHERLADEVFPDLRVGLMHGKLKPAEKDQVMKAMRSGELDVLVATTVVEVGVDCPSATIMVIEDADRFGLSQLHQLRGRVGRAGLPSRCYLTTEVDLEDDDREPTRRRLEAMCKTTDGFELAELDLELRGTGQLFGKEEDGAPAQTGRGDLIFTNLLRDQALLAKAREAAFELVARDPDLSEPEHRALKAELHRRFADRLDWLFAS